MEVYYVVQYYYKIKQNKDINLFWRFRALLEVLILEIPSLTGSFNFGDSEPYWKF